MKQVMFADCSGKTIKKLYEAWDLVAIAFEDDTYTVVGSEEQGDAITTQPDLLDVPLQVLVNIGVISEEQLAEAKVKEAAEQAARERQLEWDTYSKLGEKFSNQPRHAGTIFYDTGLVDDVYHGRAGYSLNNSVEGPRPISHDDLSKLLKDYAMTFTADGTAEWRKQDGYWTTNVGHESEKVHHEVGIAEAPQDVEAE